METVEELVQAMEGVEGLGLSPAIITNLNVDPSKITSFWCGDAHLKQDEVVGRLAEGFVVIRIQSEFRGLNLGFHTMIYMVKLRP